MQETEALVLAHREPPGSPGQGPEEKAEPNGQRQRGQREGERTGSAGEAKRDAGAGREDRHRGRAADTVCVGDRRGGVTLQVSGRQGPEGCSPRPRMLAGGRLRGRNRPRPHLHMGLLGS